MYNCDPSVTAMMQTLLARRGQIATLTTERPLKVRKGQDAITKISTFQCRVGIDYDNIQTVREKRESGELPEEKEYLQQLAAPTP